MSDNLRGATQTGASPASETATAGTEYLKRLPNRAPLAELERRGLVSFRMADVPDPSLWRELARRRQAPSATASILPISRWHEQIGDPALADGILDRLVRSRMNQCSPSVANESISMYLQSHCRPAEEAAEE